MLLIEFGCFRSSFGKVGGGVVGRPPPRKTSTRRETEVLTDTKTSQTTSLCQEESAPPAADAPPPAAVPPAAGGEATAVICSSTATPRALAVSSSEDVIALRKFECSQEGAEFVTQCWAVDRRFLRIGNTDFACLTCTNLGYPCVYRRQGTPVGSEMGRARSFTRVLKLGLKQKKNTE